MSLPLIAVFYHEYSQDILNAGEPEKILEISEFSMLRLNDIAEQRTLYSSVDDIVYAHDSDSEFDEPPENSNASNICYSYLKTKLQDLSLKWPFLQSNMSK